MDRSPSFQNISTQSKTGVLPHVGPLPQIEHRPQKVWDIRKLHMSDYSPQSHRALLSAGITLPILPSKIPSAHLHRFCPLQRFTIIPGIGSVWFMKRLQKSHTALEHGEQRPKIQMLRGEQSLLVLRPKGRHEMQGDLTWIFGYRGHAVVLRNQWLFRQMPGRFSFTSVPDQRSGYLSGTQPFFQCLSPGVQDVRNKVVSPTKYHPRERKKLAAPPGSFTYGGFHQPGMRSRRVLAELRAIRWHGCFEQVAIRAGPSQRTPPTIG